MKKRNVKIKKRKLISLLSVLLLVVIVTTMIIKVNKYIPESKAETTSAQSITIVFSSGEKEGAFDDVSVTLTANSTNGYVRFPETFAQTVTMNTDSYDTKVDDETYYFDANDYSYSFTGWQVVGSTVATPTETVFQPNDYIDINTLLAYDTDGDGVIQVEALWGKVIYAQNQYSTMYYTDYWFLDYDYMEANFSKTGSWNYKYDGENLTLNTGEDYQNPVCSMDWAYYLIYQIDYNNDFSNATSHNAYEYVIMLTGDLDYVKSSSNGQYQTNYFTAYDIYNGTYDSSKNYIFGEYVAQQQSFGYVGHYKSDGTLNTGVNDTNARTYSPSVTFKSCTKDGMTYNLNLNGYGYYDSTYSSIRIDNVKYGKPTDSQRPKNSSPVAGATETAFVRKERLLFGIYIAFIV